MIVRSVDQGWRVVFHAAHGLLAQQIAACLYVGDEFPLWPLTQIAIGMHDDGKMPFLPGNRSYLTQAGAPRDFTLRPMESDHRVADAHSQIWEATKKHRWIGCLVSYHTDRLYCDEDTTKDMQHLLDSESRWRQRTIDELSVSTEMLQRSYDWMRWCDRLSLILSGDDVPAMQRCVEIITDSTGQRFDLSRDSDGSYQITPWPFRDEAIELSLESRTLDHLCFADDAELAKALHDASVELQEFQLRSSDK